jgi:NAD(P)-dependent dehydrogenase (short-subunit alcohol dehydrogenase family)
MSNPTNKKVAIITGGATGIGKAVAGMLAAKGVQVVIAGRNKERGEAAAAETGAQTVFFKTDVSSEQDVKNLVDYTIANFGRVDYLFNNAGVEGAMGPIEINTEAILDEVLAINVKGVFLGIKHVAPIMVKQGGGIIINTASFVGTTMPIPVAVMYGASKAAVLSITRSAAAAYADQNIQLYAVCPWVTDTPMVDRLTGGDPAAKGGFARSINPSGKITGTADIAHAVTALFTEPTALTSGDAILVDFGGAVNKVVPMSVV